MRASYATAPAEFVKEARKADPLNSALPRLTLAEIADEVASLAESGASVFEKLIPAPDLSGLNPGRKRGPRAKGNKIEIKKV